MGWSFVRKGRNGYTLLDYGVSGLQRLEDEKYQDYKHRLIRYWMSEFPDFIEAGQSLLAPDEDFFIASEQLPAVGSGNFVAATQSELGKTAIVTCQVLAIQQEIQWREIAASTVKKAIFGAGSKTSKKNSKRVKVSKVDVRKGVEFVFPHLEGRWKEGWVADVSDSIGVSLCALGYKRVR